MGTLKNKFLSAVAALGLSAMAGQANATTWNVVDVMVGVDGGFGYSLLHAATGCGGMCGSVVSNIQNLNVSGSYNDTLNTFSFSASLSTGGAVGVFGFDGTLDFGAGVFGFLNQVSTLVGTFSAPGVPGIGAAPGNGTTHGNGNLATTTFAFKPGDVCCSGSGAGGPEGLHPNSFVASTTEADIAYMTLWGANFADTDPNTQGAQFGGTYAGSTLGIDLRIRLKDENTTVTLPEPLTPALLGLGFIVLARLRRNHLV